jgi:limonene-1,2-epoxide hydrolase
MSNGQDPISVANRWIEAYNAKDYETLETLMSDELHMVHHNRGVDLRGPEAALGIMRQFDDMLSTKRFHSTRRQFTDGKRVVTEQTWEATATVDIPDFVGKDETIALELCCVWTVEDGRVVEYDDYG